MAALYLDRLNHGTVIKIPVSYSSKRPPADLSWRASRRNSGSGIQLRLARVMRSLAARTFRRLLSSSGRFDSAKSVSAERSSCGGADVDINGRPKGLITG